ncbi:hypothetical protein BTHI11S_03253 [Bosea thiooxidans]
MDAEPAWLEVAPASIFTTHGLVNGTALCVDAFTAQGDGVVLMTPVCAFARVVRSTAVGWLNARWRARTAATCSTSPDGTR